MRGVIRIVLLCLLTVVTGCNRDGPLLLDKSVEQVANTIDKTVPKLLQKHDIQGQSVAVIRDGDLAFTRTFGHADTASQRRVDQQTVYRAASLGKPLFAYIVVSLAQQGKIDLDIPLSTYLPKAVIAGDPRSKSITARMVLKHTTGLPNFGGKDDELKFLFDPNTDFQYSGHAFAYLQEVIEAVTNKRLDELASEFVFQPLKMGDSSYVWQEKYRERLANSYNASGIAFPSKALPTEGHAAWSLFTTIEDYARFVSHIINTSSTANSVAAKMLASQVDVAEGVKWGLGWGLQATKPNLSFWHWGSMAGFRHYVVGYPKERVAVIVLTNTVTAFKVVDDVMVNAIGGSYPSYDWF